MSIVAGQPSSDSRGPSRGVYVHIPFCAERCDYCAFVTYVGVDDLHGRYCDAVISELGAREGGRATAASSVFFGGGTPSRVDPVLLGRILEAIPREVGCEVTVEVNPEDATVRTLETLARVGVTRVSIGIQSTAPHVLADLGRVHRGGEVRELSMLVDSIGFSSWSMDLIVGSRAESDDDLKRTLADLLDHDHRPPHLSAYLLTVERGTPLGRDPLRHPDDDDLARRYEIVDEALSERGYGWYEVSNWALPGSECRHNQLYWDQGDYIGVGAAAHSHEAGRRSWNVANLEKYLQRIEEGVSAEQGFEILDDDAQRFEALALALRTKKGVPVGAFGSVTDLEGFIEVSGERLILTRRGRLMADSLVPRLDIDAVTSFSRGGVGR